MTPADCCKELHDVAAQLKLLQARLLVVEPELKLTVDQRAIKRILTNLAWGIENCLVMGDHQVGESMDDAMGLTSDGNVV